MRPIRSTPVASTTTSPAPDMASWAQCWRCHTGLGEPSSALYWHIGEITIRLGNSSGPRVSGLNSVDCIGEPRRSKRQGADLGLCRPDPNDAAAIDDANLIRQHQHRRVALHDDGGTGQLMSAAQIIASIDGGVGPADRAIDIETPAFACNGAAGR